MTLPVTTLADLGWSAHFLSQLSIDELARLRPLRVVAVQRARATGLGPDGPQRLYFPPAISAGDVAVGDWVLTEPETGQIVRTLDRISAIGRRAVSDENRRQLIAANVDTLFIVTACNADYNVARLERYLAVAIEAGCTAVVVLTRADEIADPGALEAETRAISPRFADALALDARDPEALSRLSPWLGRGRTVAFVGSSGVGKSTLISGLTGARLATQSIREDDSKGRHTTSARTMYLTSTGALVIDTPGMRELGLQNVADGISGVFEDIVALTGDCRFRDCRHDTEPGCAVRSAVRSGALDADRVERWRKLMIEDERNTETEHERRARNRRFGRVVKVALDLKKRT
jgi:ribosome biogenesis GTPase / thiamine phosphate phosphatase